jgi:poly-gamma-glutamate capsule biosynthesis protein CapA/YwtB (metallophosphatase superfamily)
MLFPVNRLLRFHFRAYIRRRGAEICREADFCVLNLECCISNRGERWADPLKPFFFRAPPAAVDVLTGLGVDCVNLANNHALDFGYDALFDTFEHLRSAGISG